MNMAEITAAMVKDLRERSGAGMMDCKKALAETNGDIEAAIDWLRAKGLAAAGKKAGRTAAEGLVGVAVQGKKGVAVEVNSETDFVAKNEQFQAFVRDVTQLALDTGDDVQTLLAAKMGAATVQDALNTNIATIGENQNLRRIRSVSVAKGAVVSYVHNAAAPGMGKIGVLVALEGDAPTDKMEALGKQLAMHIAAAAPLALSGEGIDPTIIEREAAIAKERAADKIVGKPPEVVEKIVRGPVDKFRKENALLTQAFVIDGKTPVQDVVAAEAKAAGGSIAIKDYVRRRRATLRPKSRRLRASRRKSRSDERMPFPFKGEGRLA
jgi:elongation factor Ts